MSEFVSKFIEIDDISFLGMRNTALSLLPNDRITLGKLYDDLKRGKGILDDEAHMNMYLRSYGLMHKAKLDTAFKCLPQSENIFGEEIEIYDWGCGQGVASICLLDYLLTHNIKYSIRHIHLIDPSKSSVNRAVKVIPHFDPCIQIKATTKVFDELDTDDFTKSNVRKLHLFSNILDVESFDLASFINLFQKCFNGSNFFLCVGPFYSNNRRVDEFVAATDPDAVFATMNRDAGSWQKQWTISLRVFYKEFTRIETIVDIRKRIEESHKKDQFFAGYVLDAVDDVYTKSPFAKESEALYRALSMFDVKSNKPLDGKVVNTDSELAVLANIISRGLPTKAPLKMEYWFSEKYNISIIPENDKKLKFSSNGILQANDILEALHVVDPRFDVDFYNGDMLESNFETTFIGKYIRGSNSEFLCQILEPQRPLSSIVTIPDRQFSRDQRVDFALEIPYGNSNTGFIVELDGYPYHSNIFQRLRDEKRDRFSSRAGWDTYRIEQLRDYSFLNGWNQEVSTNRYLSIIRKNYGKQIAGSWKKYLEIVLSPMAVARVERMLLEAAMSGALDMNAAKWNILVVERDVPCAAMAIDDLMDKLCHIYSLAGIDKHLPSVDLTIVSTEEFKDSPLHLDRIVSRDIPESNFDLCLDISMLLKDNVDALPLPVDAETVYIIRSSHYKKADRAICVAENVSYPPFVTKDSSGEYVNIKEREEILIYFLQEIFRNPSFRKGQLPIISHTLANKTTIGLLPTGGGKSLTYQLSCLLQPGVSVVVDPLVSLMVDQIRGMNDARIDACECLNSGMDSTEKSKKLNMLQRGAVQLMLLSPERFMMENFRDSLMTMTEKNHVYFSYGVIDEVHCVSEWGHDFRTSYLHLGRNMINFMKTKAGSPLSIIGLTATASFDVLADVERELTLGGNLEIDSDTIVRPESDTRPELTYRIVEVRSNFDEMREPYKQYLLKAKSHRELQETVANAKRKRLASLLKEIPEALDSINNSDSSKEKPHIDNFAPSNFYQPNSDCKYQNAGIIFCPHRHGIMGVHDSLFGNHSGISTFLQSEPYLKTGTFVGGDKPSADMRRFNNNEQNLMVATKAFGMGIDKENVRFTVNFNHPSSIESYVQEAGRGGRDKTHAISYILYDPTEFIHLTVDKVNDIRYFMGEEDPIWMEHYINKYILLDDFPHFCQDNGCSPEATQEIMKILRKNDFVENIDKNVDLYFHNNSFRGLYKEKVILTEMTDRILNVKPTLLTNIQGQLRNDLGNEDISLRINGTRNSITIYSLEEPQRQYGYIFLDNLCPAYRYVNFPIEQCREISDHLIELLAALDNHSVHALLTPLNNNEDIMEGIYHALNRADKDGYVYVTVSWENNMQQDVEGFEYSIKQEIAKIAQKYEWKDIDENRHGEFKLNKVRDFDDLIAKIYQWSGDQRWQRAHSSNELYNTLRRIFCQKRDKDDTDKAIYRMCCVGLVEDVTIDYLSLTYELKIRKQSDEELRKNMLDFFRKYYSLEQAESRVSKIDGMKGRNYLDKCLGYLTAFVYDNLKKKRFRAIEDMRVACEDSISERLKTNNDEWIKEFIHLYFNSKYARVGYQVDGKDYSLTEDTDDKGLDDFDVVRKYILIMTQDSSGSEVDNVKHLYGATLLCLRAHPDNAALLLLLTYCISFLGSGTNERLKSDAFNGYVEGFMRYYENDVSDFWHIVDEFNDYIRPKCHDDFIFENIIEHGKESIMLFIHEEKFNGIVRKYLRTKDDENSSDTTEDDISENKIVSISKDKVFSIN